MVNIKKYQKLKCISYLLIDSIPEYRQIMSGIVYSAHVWQQWWNSYTYYLSRLFHAVIGPVLHVKTIEWNKGWWRICSLWPWDNAMAILVTISDTKLALMWGREIDKFIVTTAMKDKINILNEIGNTWLLDLDSNNLLNK